MRERVERERAEARPAPPRARPAGLAGAVLDLQRSAGNAATALAVQRAPAASKLATGPRPRLQPVSEPSDVHRQESLSRNYKKIADHAAFSVAPTALMAADTALVNRFVRALAGDAPWTDDIDDVAYDTAPAPMVHYYVNGRVYSTHANSAQLYPLHGPGVIRGAGAVDMAHVLDGLGLLDEGRRITLVSMALGPALTKTPKQLGKAEARSYLDRFPQLLLLPRSADPPPWQFG